MCVCRLCGVGENSVASNWVYVARMISSIFFVYHIAIVFGTYSYMSYVICPAGSMGFMPKVVSSKIQTEHSERKST